MSRTIDYRTISNRYGLGVAGMEIDRLRCALECAYIELAVLDVAPSTRNEILVALSTDPFKDASVAMLVNKRTSLLGEQSNAQRQEADEPSK